MQAPAQVLPFPDATFDAVLNTMILHYLPSEGRKSCLREMARVVRPGGRVLAVDFAAAAREQGGFLGRFHRHGHVRFPDLLPLLGGAGLSVIESGAVGWRGLQFAVATEPGRSSAWTGIARSMSASR